MKSALSAISVPRQAAWAERIGEENARRRLEAERLRIARELHDVVSYGFAAIGIQAGVAAHVLDERPERALEALHAIRTASKEALDDLRAILALLRRADGLGAKAPGLDRLDALAESTSGAGVETRVEISGEPRPLPAGIDCAAYRIVQEALANVLRHAGRPASAFVSVVYETGRLLITVEDDGAGTNDGDNDSNAAGYGIVGMRERALALGGDLQAGPREGNGFRVRADLATPRHP